jgi:UDP-GlcNAc:undecaprenyl-phosphate GlcNAc-1-phosphate transferase
MQLLMTLAVPMVFVYFTTPFFRKLAIRFRIMDFPGKRKIHKRVTPLAGGIAIYFGVLAGLLADPQIFGPYLIILTASTMIFILGLLDDMKGLSARIRLFVQIFAALLVTLFCDRVNFFPPCLWGDFLEILVSVVWVVGITNAFNYLDGLDGLAAGSAVINAACFGLILHSTGQSYLSILAVILIGACLGFLPHNFKQKKVFLGDSGSTLLGFVIACIGLVGYWAEGDIVKITIPILILGVPIFDMVFTTIMRIREKKISTVAEWLKYGGKDHFHHYLVDLGLNPAGSVIFIYFTTFTLGLSAVMVSGAYGSILAFLSLAQAAIIFGIIGILIVFGKRLHKKHDL